MIYNKYPAKSTAIAPPGEVSLKSKLYWVKNHRRRKHPSVKVSGFPIKNFGNDE